MIPSYENFKDFKDASEKILEYLHNHLGFALWMITRVNGNLKLTPFTLKTAK